jgi:hypothetical protein
MSEHRGPGGWTSPPAFAVKRALIRPCVPDGVKKTGVGLLKGPTPYLLQGVGGSKVLPVGQGFLVG